MGVKAASDAKIPVHAVGVGDPKRGAEVWIDGEPLFGTTLQEKPLELIAAEEGCNRIDLIVEALQFAAGEDLADVGADEAADDAEGLGHTRRMSL